MVILSPPAPFFVVTDVLMRNNVGKNVHKNGLCVFSTRKKSAATTTQTQVLSFNLGFFFCDQLDQCDDLWAIVSAHKNANFSGWHCQRLPFVASCLHIMFPTIQHPTVSNGVVLLPLNVISFIAYRADSNRRAFGMNCNYYL